MTDPQNDTIRRQWVAMLAKLVAPMDQQHAAKALADMLPLLHQVPDAAFTMGSLEAVAKQCKRVPSYGELREHIAAWWKDNRPTQTTIAGPDEWSQRIAREHDYAHADWEGITTSNIRDRIQSANNAPTEGMRKAMRGILVTAIRRHAPQHLGMLPPDWLDDGDNKILRFPLPPAAE